MKLVWLNIIAIIIACSSIVIDGPSIHQTNSPTIETIKQIPLLVSEALKDEFSKYSSKVPHIAQDFIPIVLIADSRQLINNFFHYISIHSLVRQKEYFLQI